MSYPLLVLVETDGAACGDKCPLLFADASWCGGFSKELRIVSSADHRYVRLPECVAAEQAKQVPR